MNNYAEIVNGIVVNANFVASQTNKNYVLYNRGGVSWTFDGANFIAPKPYLSWILDENFDWQPPTPMPIVEGKRYEWFESNKEWIELIN